MARLTPAFLPASGLTSILLLGACTGFCLPSATFQLVISSKERSVYNSCSCSLHLTSGKNNLAEPKTQKSFSFLCISFFTDFHCCLSVVLFRYPFHLCVTAVSHKRPRSSCQKRRWQVTAKHAYTLRMWLCMK